MKKVRIKPIAIYWTVCIVSVICLAIYIWVNVPIYPEVVVEVENEDALIEALQEDMPEIVYPDFLIDALEPEGICYQIEVPERKRFSSVEGYRITGNITISGKECKLFLQAVANGYEMGQVSFEYRTAKGYFKKIEQAITSGSISFNVEEQRYLIECLPSRTKGQTTAENRKAIDEYLLNLAHQIIDMKIEGDTIGKK